MNPFLFLRPTIFVALLSLLITGCSESGSGNSLLGGSAGDNPGDNPRGNLFLPPSLVSIQSGNYRNQKPIDLIVTFIQPVQVSTSTTSTDHRPFIALTIGDEIRPAIYLSGSGTRSLVFRYIVQADDQDIDGIEVSEIIVLNNSEINYADMADLSGLTSSLVPLVLNTPNNLSSVKVFNGGSVGPSVPLYVQSNTNLDIPIIFHEDVTVDTSESRPEIDINIGGSVQRAVYESGSGSDTLIFRYAIPQDTEEGEVTLGRIIRHGERITYSTDNIEVVASVGPPAESSFVAQVDNTAPMIVSGQEAQVTGGSYNAGSSIDISVPFNEDILVTGSGTPPSIALNIGSTPVVASYQSGSGTSTLVFRYTVESGHRNGNDPITLIPNINLNNGSITDKAGNILSAFAFGLPTNLASVVVDGTIPTITSVEIPSGYYTVSNNSEINITLNISEHVTVDDTIGTPAVELRIGDIRRNAEYVSGSGSAALVFRYMVQAGDNSNGGIDITYLRSNGGTIKDNQDNDLIFSIDPPSNISEVIVDTMAPTISIVAVADGISSTLDMAVRFSEPVSIDTGGGIPRIPVTFGSASGFATFASILREDTLIFRYIVEEGWNSTENISIASPLQLNGGSITDLAGHDLINMSFVPPTNMTSIQIDTIAPVIDTVTIPTRTYVSGGRIEFTVPFSEVVTVDARGGMPNIAIDLGGEERFADYAFGGGTDTLTFRYTIVPGEYDEDGIGVASSIVLNDGIIRDLAGNDAVLTFTPPTNRSGIMVDAIIPVINTVAVTTGNYVEGGNIDISIAFNREVNITGSPTLSLRVGENNRTASYYSGGGTNTLVFRYTVLAGEIDLDGIELRPSINARNGSISDFVGNDVTDFSFYLPSNLASVRLDSTLPIINSVSVEDGTYGGNVDLRVSFSEVVFVTAGPPTIALNVNGTSKKAVYTDGSGSNELVFRYIVGLSDRDIDGVGITTNLELAGGSITDIFGNALSELSFRAPSNLGNVYVDGTVTFINEMTTANGIYKEGENIDFVAVYNRNVVVTGTPNIAINVGGDDKVASYNPLASEANRLIFRYIVESNVNDDDGIEMTPSIVLNEGSIVDVASVGRSGDLNFTGPTNLALVKVDTTDPILNSVSIADGTYGGNMDISVVFSEPVNIGGTGIPSIPLTVGGESRTAVYELGSGTDTLIFRYVVQPNERDSGGIEMASSINLNDGTITDAGGNAVANATDVSIGFTLPTNLASVFVDGVRPTLNSVNIPNGTYNEHLNISIVFSEEVIVGGTGTPSISLTVGNQNRTAVFESGSGSDTLIFRYSIPLREQDNDGIEMATSIQLDDGIITDRGGNIPVGGSVTSLPFTVPTNLEFVRVDRVLPTILSVAVDDGIYRDNMDIRVVFSEPVTALGGPTIPLRINGESRMAVFESGSGSDTLIFRHSVVSDDSTTGGIEMASPIALGSGDSIEDIGGNRANLAFSLPSNLTSVNVDRAAPTIDTVTVVPGRFRAGQNLDITVNFREAVNVVTTSGTPKIVLTMGGDNDTRDALYNASMSSERALVFRYTVVAGDNNDTGMAMVSSINLDGGTIKDRAGNNAATTFTAPESSQVFVDTLSPTIDSVTTIVAGSYREGDHLDVTVTFNEAVTIVTDNGIPKIVLTVGNENRDALYNESESTNTAIVFRYTVVAGDSSNGTRIAIASSIELEGGTIRDAVNNDALVSFTPIDSSGVLVDNTPPTINTVTTVAAGTYITGQHLDILVTFNEVVNIVTGGGIPKIILTVGDDNRDALYNATESTSTVVVFRYTLVAGDEDNSGGIVINSSIDKNGGTIKDLAGNDAVTSFTVPDSSQVLVDAVAPSIDSVTTVAAGTYIIGQHLDVTVTFDDTVTVATAGGVPKIVLTVGEDSRDAVYNPTDSTGTSLVFRYTVEADDTSGSAGVAVASSIELSGGTIRDSLGNDAERTFTSPDSSQILVDGIVPTVDSVVLAPRDYMTGDRMDIVVTFSEAVAVVTPENDSPPSITLDIEGTSRSAMYHSTGSTNRELVFHYTVVSEDSDRNGIGMSSPIVLNDGTIKDTSGNDAAGSFTFPDLSRVVANHDTTAPMITFVTVPNRHYATGTDLDIIINFNEIVNVVTPENNTPPAISLDLDGATKSAGFVSGSGSNALTFRYVVESSVRAPYGIGMNSPLLLNDGTIRDVAENDAVGTFELPELSEVKVNDNVAPTITSITVAGQNYATGAHLDITVQWNERVNVAITANGTPPKITVDIEGSDRDAVYNSSLSESRALVFRYTVVEEDKDMNGIEIDSPLVLNDGTIQDVAGNNATLTFTSPVLSQTTVNVTVEEYKGSKLFEGIYLINDTKFAWGDVNRDNRPDLVVGGSDGKLKYYEATATSFKEKRGSDNPFNDVDVGYFSAPVFANLDDDDALELVIGEENGTLKYYDLVGSDTDNDNTDDTWTWTEKAGSANPFDDINIGMYTYPSPTFANLDTDSKLELVIGEIDGTLKYFDLVGSDTDNDNIDDTWTWTEKTSSANPFSDIDVGGHAAPTFVNLDTDTDLELVIGETDGTLKYYDLVGTTWTEQTGSDNPFSGIDVGVFSAPIFADFNNDTELELAIGEQGGILNYYNQVGSAWTEEMDWYNPFHGINVGSRSTPTFANLDTDDHLELVVGEADGNLNYYDLVGSDTDSDNVIDTWTWAERTGSSNPFNHIDVGDYSSPFFADIDDDDHLELVIGNALSGRRIIYYDFVTSTSIWVERTGLENPLHNAYVGANAVPTFADWDSDNNLEFLVGGQSGRFSAFDLVGNTWTEITGSNNPFDSFSRRSYSAPHFVDLDDDGELELVIGAEDGILKYYDLVGNTWTEATGTNNPFGGINFERHSFPSSANLDDDDDLELVVGNKSGELVYGDFYGEEWVYFR